MKAIVLNSFGDSSHFKLQEVEMPQPKAGEVRIRLRAAGFNPVDFKIREGMFGGVPPVILGADCSGIIDTIGPKVSGFKQGEEVYAMPFGQCSNGSYAEYLCLPAPFVARKPKTLSFEQAAVTPLAAMTAYRAMIASSALKKGDTIFIAGAGGGVGSLAVSFAKYARVGSIFTVASSVESAAFLQNELGLKKEHILIYKGLTPSQIEEKLIAMNGGRLFDATFDLVGGEVKRLCLNLTQFSGHFASIVPDSKEFIYPVWERGVSPCFNKNMSLHLIFVGSESMGGPPNTWGIYARHMNHISELIDQGDLKAPSVNVVGTFSVETVREAHRLLEEGRVKGKLAMKMG